jgi:hypothetical protein
MDNLQKLKSEKKFANFISSITHPPLVSIPTFAIINYFLLGLMHSLTITGICWIFGAFLPILTSLILIEKMHTDIDITDRTKRTLPLFYAVCSYLIGFFILFVLSAPSLTTALMFIYFSNTLIILFINLSWKISIHAMGVAGPTVALVYLFGLPWLNFWPYNSVGDVEPGHTKKTYCFPGSSRRNAWYHINSSTVVLYCTGNLKFNILYWFINSN